MVAWWVAVRVAVWVVVCGLLTTTVLEFKQRSIAMRGEAGCGGSHSRCGDYPHSDLVLLQLPQRERSREPGVARVAGRAS